MGTRITIPTKTGSAHLKQIPSVTDDIFANFVPRWKPEKVGIAVLGHYDTNGGFHRSTQNVFSQFVSSLGLLPDCDCLVLVDADSTRVDEFVSAFLSGNPESFVLYDERGQLDALYDVDVIEYHDVLGRYDLFNPSTAYTFNGDLSLLSRETVEYAYKKYFELTQTRMSRAISCFTGAGATQPYGNGVRFGMLGTFHKEDNLSMTQSDVDARNGQFVEAARAMSLDRIDVPEFTDSSQLAAQAVEEMNLVADHPLTSDAKDSLRSFITPKNPVIALPEKYQAIVDRYETATHSLGDIRKIWDNALSKLPLKISIDWREDYDLETMKELAPILGVDSTIEAYVAGVPLDDVLC